MKISEIGRIPQCNIARIFNWSSFIIVILALIFCISIFLNPLSAVGLIILCIYCVTYWISPKKALLLLGIFLVFQSLIVRIVGGSLGNILNQGDELFIVISFILTVTQRLFNRQSLRIKQIGISLLFLTVIGFISSYLSNLTNSVVIFSAYLLLIKGFLIFYTFFNMDFTETEIKIFVNTFLVLGMLVVITTVINILFPEPFTKLVKGFYLYRMGILSPVSIFGHPGGLGTFMEILACFSIAFYLITKKKGIIILFMIFLFTAMSSLRLMPNLGIFFAVVFAVTVLQSAEKKRVIFVPVIIGGVFSLIFADKIIEIVSLHISNYITTVDPYKNARDVLYLTSFKIAADYFPFGSGLGTYGGWISKLHYSPLYYKYGLSNVWGLSPNTGQFLNDTFWPHILAELGIIGCICYVLIFYQFFKFTIKGIRSFTSQFQQSYALGTFMILISSLVESSKFTIYEQSLWVFLIFGSVGITCSLLKSLELEKE